jgi:hypothetical protein
MDKRRSSRDIRAKGGVTIKCSGGGGIPGAELTRQALRNGFLSADVHNTAAARPSFDRELEIVSQRPSW